jgi:hypothetical protein
MVNITKALNKGHSLGQIASGFGGKTARDSFQSSGGFVKKAATMFSKNKVMTTGGIAGNVGTKAAGKALVGTGKVAGGAAPLIAKVGTAIAGLGPVGWAAAAAIAAVTVAGVAFYKHLKNISPLNMAIKNLDRLTRANKVHTASL